uniref:Nuclear pore complex protein NUP205 n=2 Tax=Kalanchoe fedtschenkoi TaxID=63787 RepID=A0A7N0VJ21_KALFE
MVSPRQLLSIIELTLLGPSPPTPSQRIELMQAIRKSLPSLQNLLSYPPPKPSDRSQVQSREVRLPDSPPITLDDQDVQITLKLSDDLHLNEIDCVCLLVSANQEWGLMGRDPIEILRLTAGMWYMERRDTITALYALLRAVVLDQGLDTDVVTDIQRYLEDLFRAGLRQRLIILLKELNRHEPGGLGGPNSEHYVLDSRGSIVEREAVVQRERLILSHCLVLSTLVVRTSPKDVKDLLSLLKDTASELSGCNDDILRQQITFSLLFSIVIAFISDGLGAVSDKVSVLSSDSLFRREFQEIIIAAGSNPIVEGFVDAARLAWAVHLMLTEDLIANRETVSSVSANGIANICSCLEVIFSNNVFQFLLDKVLRTAAYQNGDEDMIYMYNAYMHKLITCFLSHPVATEKVKEEKEKAMSLLSSYRMAVSHDAIHDRNLDSQSITDTIHHPFISLLDVVSEIYQREPELLSGNDVLWTFVNFAGEDHSNVQTLVAFLTMLASLASNSEGASRIYELLQGKIFRTISWRTLFDCLSIYEEKFKQAIQTAGANLPEFQEGDAKALVAYLNVLQKVMENGNPIEKKNWFSDIQPLFKLLSYENVPPYLKGAMRNAISTFIPVSPILKDTIWSYLEQYDLPVVVGPDSSSGVTTMTTQVYDMRFELNEIEGRRERYPSTISFLNLLNALIAEEKDFRDRGHRFIGIFRFICDHVFGPFPQRAYADPSEKWQLVVACLQHFKMILSMYDIKEEDIDTVIDQSNGQSSPLNMQLPVVELLKDFMSGKTVFRNIMHIILPGVNSIIAERSTQVYGQLLEKAVLMSLEIIILVLEKDMMLSDFWGPQYQSVDIILTHDQNQIVALLEYVRYEANPQIQQCSIKIMDVLSSRVPGLTQLLLKSNAANSMVEDYAACLEIRSEESQAAENDNDDLGVLIMQLLINNISRPAPNITHLLLKFDIDTPVERTVLQPKFHYSCLRVILDVLENLSKPDVNALLHEFGFQLLYELCLDPLTSAPIMDLLCNKKYHFFVKHLNTIGISPLPKRSSNQAFRISSLHQRAWLLKLLTFVLHAGDATIPSQRETIHSVLVHLYKGDATDSGTDHSALLSNLIQNDSEIVSAKTISKVLGLLEVMQFKSPDTSMKFSESISNTKFALLAEEILSASTSEKGGIYYFSERGDRLIDLASLRDSVWQKYVAMNPQLSSMGVEVELNSVREMIQHLLRWGWKHNKNLEEQAAQLHMLTSWSQIVEISASRRLLSVGIQSDTLFEILYAVLSASASPDCSLKMALILSQVALTCMAKLRDGRFVYPTPTSSDSITLLDIITARQLPNGACHSILLKLIMSILRSDSSEALRRRQYALLLSYFQYCGHMVDLDVPTRVLHPLILDEQDGEDVTVFKINQELEELARTNFLIIKKEAQAMLNLIIKDAKQSSESGKTIALYVLDAFVAMDQEKFLLGQLQSRGFLRTCLMNISNFSYQDSRGTLDLLQRACTIEAQLALLLRISHKYGKSGAQILFSMGALEHIASCKAINVQLGDTKMRRDVNAVADTKKMIVAPILRLVFSLTSLIETSDFFEVKNKVVREAVSFVKGHQSLFDQVLRIDISEGDESAMELINLVVGILSKVWPYEESDEYGFVQGLFVLMRTLFSKEWGSFTCSQDGHLERRGLSETGILRLCFSLSSYLYYLVTRKSLRLQVSDGPIDYHAPVRHQPPALTTVSSFLNLLATGIEKAADEKSLLLNKIQDINELSRQEVDEIISICAHKDSITSADDTQKRRYIAMVDLCELAGARDNLITLQLLLAEHLLNVILVHFQDGAFTCGVTEENKAITFTGHSDTRSGLSNLCENLVATLERLELLSEEKVGHKLKVFQRLVSSLKEVVIRVLEA